MNKQELVSVVAETTSHSKKDVDTILGAILDQIIATVGDAEKLTLVGFGSFEARDRRAREGRNPQTGEKMTIPATRVPVFSAGKGFKERVLPLGRG